MQVNVTYTDGSFATFTCDDFGHSQNDSWVVLLRENDPYVMISSANVRSLSLVYEDDEPEFAH